MIRGYRPIGDCFACKAKKVESSGTSGNPRFKLVMVGFDDLLAWKIIVNGRLRLTTDTLTSLERSSP